MPQAGFNEVVEAYREALRHFVTGDPEPVTRFYSTRDDVTLANPLGPPRRGPADVRNAIMAGAANFGEGGPLQFDEVSSQFEEVSRYATPDLGYVVQLERFAGRQTGTGDDVVNALRVTMIFRREDGEWKVAHRHADPITTARPISTVVQPASRPA
jgi:ketosteroid isomerase-like protein